MNMFAPGAESLERINLMLKLTKVSSSYIRAALITHLVKGADESDAVFMHDVDLSNFRRALKGLNEKAQIVEKIKELDWSVK